MDLPPEQRLGLDIKRAEQALIRAKTRALKPANLTVAQYAALLTLKDNPGMSAAALARACLVTPQAMTSVLKLLHEHGLVERRPHAWHQHVLETHLTDTGRAAVTTADREAVRIERRILDALSPTERDILRDLLNRCVEAIEAGHERLRSVLRKRVTLGPWKLSGCGTSITICPPSWRELPRGRRLSSPSGVSPSRT